MLARALRLSSRECLGSGQVEVSATAHLDCSRRGCLDGDPAVVLKELVRIQWALLFEMQLLTLPMRLATPVSILTAALIRAPAIAVWSAQDHAQVIRPLLIRFHAWGRYAEAAAGLDLHY